MNEKIKDFIQMSLFGLAIFTAILIVVQMFINIVYFFIDGLPPSLYFNLRFFIAFELFFVLLSLLIGLAYVFWFVEYKNKPNGKRISRRKYKN